LLSLLVPLTSAQAQANDPVASLIARMTPEQKVGQLFLVSFSGTDTSATSQIYDLIVNRYVGGVVFTTANDNFVAAPSTAVGALSLVSALQQTEWDGARNPVSPSTQHPYIPLFIGISQEGGGYPNDQILSGLTPIPSQMALGAAWDRTLAEKSGEALGSELSALGFNFYLGLSLDVLNAPNPAVDTGLNARVFGGNPYWVGQMGRAFVSGLHTGSLNRMAVIAKHFPGRGGSDRLTDQEVPTVLRSLDDLKQIDLAPFFAVTGAAPSPDMVVDGVLVSHIRYQGFQGNIRTTTRPISFDQQGLGQVLALPQVQPWWQGGGLVVSDDLGLQAVRGFYDPDNKTFSARLVARDAFLAGNDLLYMGNITSSDAPDNYTTVLRTLDSFSQKYREDPAFAGRVDDSLRRILTVKYRFYPTFVISAVLPGPLPDTLGQSTDNVFAIARQAATLISPSQANLASVLPSPPKASDYILFITDTGSSHQCSSCPDVPVMPVDTFQSAVTRLYGPSAAGLVSASHLSSYSFSDVDLLLQGNSPKPDLLNNLGRANIVVISALDLPVGQPQTQILRRFLTEKQSLLSSKSVIMFSFGAPYYLDATDISKLDAYYGMYSQSAPFVEVAARLLFQEVSPLGSSPVSIPGTGYSLETATSPDPNKSISLNLDLPVVSTPTPEASATLSLTTTPTVEASLTPTVIPVPLFKLNDTIAVRTGIILDHNKHPVPDGTLVRFVLLLFQGENGLTQQSETMTVDGVAAASFRLNQLGSIEIQVSSGQAKGSNAVQLNVTDEGAGEPAITTVPTSAATPTPTEIPPTPSPTPKPGTPLTTPQGYPSFLGWFLALLLMMAGMAVVYWLGLQFAEARWAARWALLALLGGLAAYNYLVLDMPGSVFWVDDQGMSAFLQAILLGQVMGFLGGWVWRLMSERGNQAQEQQDRR
jgi:beta-N-acetylhexosaminidase